MGSVHNPHGRKKLIEAIVYFAGNESVYARFLTLPRQRRLDSVSRHRRWQQDLDKDRFFDQVFGAQVSPG